MWNSKWLKLFDSVKEVEKQSRIRDNAYIRLRTVNAYIEEVKKSQSRRRGAYNELSAEELNELKLHNSSYKSAYNACIGAEWSLKIAKTQSVNALNELLRSVGETELTKDFAVLIKIVRYGDIEWVRNADFHPIGNTDPYVEVFYAPKDKLNPSDNNIFSDVRHGHICISKPGITYMRRYDKPRGTHNFFTRPLRSAKLPSPC